MSDINQDNPNQTEQNDESAPVTEKKKLTDTQLRVVQFIAGAVSAIALVLSMYIPTMLVKQKVLEEGHLLTYLFVLVFVVIMFGRRRIENKYRLRLGLFSVVLIDGILIGVIVYLIEVLYGADSPVAATMAEVYKVLIIAGGVLVLLVAGILLPVLRYLKRVKNGTVIPIRLPEKPQPAAGADAEPEAHDGPMTIEQRVAAMLAEADAAQAGAAEGGKAPEEADKETKTE